MHHLPRQARDKHRESAQKRECVSLGERMTTGATARIEGTSCSSAAARLLALATQPASMDPAGRAVVETSRDETRASMDAAGRAAAVVVSTYSGGA